MNLNIIIFLLFMTSTVSTHNNMPKVHEELNEQLLTDSSDNVRKLRESVGYSALKNFYQPPTFNFGSARQQDQRKFRYAQQQFVDLNNILLRKPLMKYNSLSNSNRNQTIESRQAPPVQVSLVQNWKAVNPELVNNQKLLPSYQLLIKFNETKPNPVPKISVRVGRKLKPDTNFQSRNEFVHKSSINRQDHIQGNGPIIYVDSNFLHKHFGLDPNVAQNILANSVPNESKSQQELNALNDLIGKNPNVQLEGLKQLLESGAIQGKDHTPIMEQTVDIPNRQIKPNIIVNHDQANNNQINQPIPLQVHDQALKAIQAHLDSAAQAETQRVLEQAQKDALAHVEAQHQAIAKAQADAQQAALAKIAAQNQAYGHPQALPLKGNVIHIPVNVGQSQDQQEHVEVAHSHVPVNPIALSLKAEILSTTAKPILDYQPNVGHQTLALFQDNQAVRVHQNNEIYHNHVQPSPVLFYSQQQNVGKHRQPTLEKVSVTKTHSVTQGQHTPSAYQEVVLETEHQRETVYPTEQKSKLESQDKQYAARYAFGYRIKDFEQGNDFGHEEKRDGKSAKGQYHVLLPDGRLQKVEYYADPTGYHAKVSYENVAHH